MIQRPVGPACAGCALPITSKHGLYVRGGESWHSDCEMLRAIGYVEVVRSPDLMSLEAPMREPR